LAAQPPNIRCLDHQALWQLPLERSVPAVVDWRHQSLIQSRFDPASIVCRLLLRKCQHAGESYSWQTAYILSKTSEQRSRTSRDVISVRRDRLLRTKSELIVQIEINCQLVTVVIVGDTKAAANDGFMIRAKQLRQHSTLKSRRPRDGYARLEVVL